MGGFKDSSNNLLTLLEKRQLSQHSHSSAASSSSTTNIGNHQTLHHLHHSTTSRQASHSIGEGTESREMSKDKERRNSGHSYFPQHPLPSIPSAGDFGSIVSGSVGVASSVLPSTVMTISSSNSSNRYNNSTSVEDDVAVKVLSDVTCDPGDGCQSSASANQSCVNSSSQSRRCSSMSILLVSTAIVSVLIFLFATDFAGSYYYHHLYYHNHHNGMISSKGQHYYYNHHFYQHHLRPSTWSLPLNLSLTGSSIGVGSQHHTIGNSGGSSNGVSSGSEQRGSPFGYSLANLRQSGSTQQRYYYLISTPSNADSNANGGSLSATVPSEPVLAQAASQEFSNTLPFNKLTQLGSSSESSPSSFTSSPSSSTSSATSNQIPIGPDILHQISLNTRFNYSILYPNQQEKILVYLTALFNGVKILEAPVTNTLLNAIYDCERDSKPSLLYNQHALEVRFPTVLSDMDQLAKRDDFISVVNFASSTTSGSNAGISTVGNANAFHQGVNTRMLFKINHEERRTEEPLSSIGTNGVASNALNGAPPLASNPGGNNAMQKLLSHAVFRAPLFYYLNSAFYTVVYCSYTPRRKEDWRSGLEYLNEIAVDITKSDTWKKNHGMDFVVPASHPKSGPNTFDPASINEFARASYMRTDFDFHGNSPKDIVVPYYTKPTHWDVIMKMKNETAFALQEDAALFAKKKKILAASSGRSIAVGDGATVVKLNPKVPGAAGLLEDPEGKRETIKESEEEIEDRLLVFIGSDNPVGGLRHHLHRAFKKLNYPDIFFTVTDFIPTNAYKSYLVHSEFCLSVRGDTASASRLFSIISLGTCIPVIVSDWLPLPFESIIDYSKFTLRFPESIVNHVEDMVTFLRSISRQQRDQLRQGLREARDMLLYEQAENQVTLLNPISLTLIEMLQRREKLCKGLGSAAKLSSMCEKIKRRMYLAQQVVASTLSNSGVIPATSSVAAPYSFASVP